tara:strand:+ start:4144 stop:5892 length:1749 start_codon:yes stop_codon:yes gene_type:complete
MSDYEYQINEYKNKHTATNGLPDFDNDAFWNDEFVDGNSLQHLIGIDQEKQIEDEWKPSHKLNPDQKLAIKMLKDGKNIFITGQAGTGKSLLIKEIITFLKIKYGNPIGMSNCSQDYAITSLTGISSVSINGQTLHKWGGIGLGEGSIDKLLRVIDKRLKTASWRTISVLVIDEVSMMSRELFEKLHLIAVRIRGNSRKLFGGIQLILCGDFLQLSPIGKGEAGQFCFQSPIWNRFISKENTIHLTKIYRQNDPYFQDLLTRIRLGLVTPKDRKLLESRIVKKVPKMQIKPTKLYPFKKDVASINGKELNKLIENGSEVKIFWPIYMMEIREKQLAKLGRFNRNGKRQQEEMTKFVNQFSKELRDDSGKRLNQRFKDRPENKLVKICVDAQVMLNYNINVEKGLANGVKGIVKRFEQGTGHPICKFEDVDEEIIVTPSPHFYDREYYKVTIMQYPLELAWATTIHRSQSQTLSKVVTDLACVFCPGQTYVCLSRVKSLAGLYLKAIDFNKIKCNITARKYYYDLGYICEAQYVDNCTDLMSTTSYMKHPGICHYCLVYYLCEFVNLIPPEINQKIVNYIEAF